MTPPTAVFDCMVFVQAVANARGPAAACWELAGDGTVILFVSPPTVVELGDVLTRPKLAQKLYISAEAARAFLAEVGRRCVLVTAVPERFAYPRDPKDEKYLNLTLASSAAFLVTWDNDLLDLMTDDNADGRAFRALGPTVRIVTPPDFLARVRGAAGGGTSS